jgi:hypothetical protein
MERASRDRVPAAWSPGGSSGRTAAQRFGGSANRQNPSAFAGWKINTPSHFAGLRIYAQANWPRIADGTRTVRFAAHPLILWLAKWVPLPTYQEVTFLKYRDADPLVDERRGLVFCSLAQAAELRKLVGQNPSSFAG